MAILFAGITKQIESDAGGAVFLGSHLGDRFLPLALSALAALHGIGG